MRTSTTIWTEWKPLQATRETEKAFLESLRQGKTATGKPPEYKKFTLLTDAERKKIPVYDGFIRYFPNAIVAVAQNSAKGNEQHNPGKPLFWDRSKSKDERGSLTRHLIDQAIHENDGNMVEQIEAAKAKAWRAMADLEKLLEDYYE